MAVRRSTTPDSHLPGPLSRQSPIRSCIGCRQRATAAELLRIVVMPDATGEAEHDVSAAQGRLGRPQAGPVAGVASLVVPDPRRRMPGRGAWLHPVPDCVELGQRRRAIGRALRVSGMIDPRPVSEYVASLNSEAVPASQCKTGNPAMTASGTPQEMTSNGHSMKRQQ